MSNAILDPTALMSGAGEHATGTRPYPPDSDAYPLSLVCFQVPTAAAFALAVIGVEGLEGPHVETGAWVDLYGLAYVVSGLSVAGLGLLTGAVALTKAANRRRNALGRTRFHIALATSAIFVAAVAGMWMRLMEV